MDLAINCRDKFRRYHQEKLLWSYNLGKKCPYLARPGDKVFLIFHDYAKWWAVIQSIRRDKNNNWILYILKMSDILDSYFYSAHTWFKGYCKWRYIDKDLSSSMIRNHSFYSKKIERMIYIAKGGE